MTVQVPDLFEQHGVLFSLLGALAAWGISLDRRMAALARDVAWLKDRAKEHCPYAVTHEAELGDE